MRKRDFLRHGTAGLLLAAGSGLPLVAWAVQYQSPQDAMRVLFPTAQRFAPLPAERSALTPALRAHVLRETGSSFPPGDTPQWWSALDTQGQQLGLVALDHAVGKTELIDFALGFAPDHAITGVEVLAYRESHGAEIRLAAWRRQFVGRQSPRQLRFGDDIRNIAGATLSCQHVSDAVQRLSAMVALLP
jgi:hypothetical protein